jgi:hypothetical protein
MMRHSAYINFSSEHSAKAYRFENHASTSGDHNSFREYGQLESENKASCEYESRGFSRKGRVPKVMPIGIPCNLNIKYSRYPISHAIMRFPLDGDVFTYRSITESITQTRGQRLC